MARVYHASYNVKHLDVNFNLKMWRQDLGDFIRKNKFWDGSTRVTKAKSIPKGPNIISKGVKTFSIYNAYGGSVDIQFQNMNELLYTNEPNLVKEYLISRGINNEMQK